MNDKHHISTEIVEALTFDSEPWLSCDDCFEEVDSAIEKLLASRDPFTESFRVHLQACPACQEEAYSLVSLVAENYSIDPDEATRMLDLALAAS